MVETTFFVAIEKIELTTGPGRGDTVGSTFYVTTDRGFIERMLPPECWPLLGTIELNSLLDGRPVAFTRTSIEGQDEAATIKGLVGWLRLVTMFLQHCWLIKDSAAGLELGYAMRPTADGLLVSRNFLGSVYSDAKCDVAPRRFSRDEFAAAKTAFERSLTRLRPSVAAGTPFRPNRPERAFLFVQAARIAESPYVKIANYCTALEALFSNDNTELAHKLAERVAWFLAHDSGQRLELFRRIKKAYSIRSKVVHGAADFTREIESASETSSFLDETLREVFGKLYGDSVLHELFEADTDSGKRRHDEFFMSLALGSKMPTPQSETR